MIVLKMKILVLKETTDILLLKFKKYNIFKLDIGFDALF